MTVHEKRLDAVRVALAEAGLDAGALLPGASTYYTTGIHSFVDRLTTVLLIPAAGARFAERPMVVLPDFEKDTLTTQMPFDVDYLPYARNAEGYTAAFAEAAQRWGLGGKRIGVEGVGFRYREFRELTVAAPDVAIEPADDLFMSFRLHKSAEEIACIREAARLTEVALDAMTSHLTPGTTEQELRNRFQIEVLEAGAEGLGFDSLVVSGPRAALQHAAPSERAIERGDVVLFDVGARYRQYTADITRTFVVGEASEEIRTLYEIVREANEAAFRAAAPGVPARDVDAAARDIITAAGYGDTFQHGTGHGLGLDVHEPPRVAVGSDAVLEPGMVFTVEPGIYLLGKLGIRIEDDVVITEDGAERLTAFDHALAVA